MPIYFTNVLYDYYLVYIIVFTMICASVIGSIVSYTSKGNPDQVMTVICIIIAICIGIWMLLIARVSFATYTDWYMIYQTYGILLLSMATMVQLFLMPMYVKFIYTTTLFRIFLLFVFIKAIITQQYYANYKGMMMFNILGMWLETCALFIIVTMISIKFTYYLKNN